MRNPPFKAILFDMDGVIIDSEPEHERAFREMFEILGYGQTHGIDFPAYYGRSDITLLQDFVRAHSPAQTVEQLAQLKHQRFVDIIRRKKPLFAGIPQLVHDLSLRYQLAIGSGSFHRVINEVLAMENLRRYFPVVVSSQDVPKGKPAPDIYLRAAELLGITPGDCVVVEDAEAGVQSALTAGMQVIAITNSLPATRLSNATRVVETYAELRSLLLPD